MIEESEGTFYNFSIERSVFEKGETFTLEPFFLYTKVPKEVTFPYVIEFNPMPFFFPSYQTNVVGFEEFPEQFLIKEGTRCNYKCSKFTKECEAVECWDRPFVCFGDRKECLKLEGNGTCIKTTKDESSKVKESEDKDYQILTPSFFADLFRLVTVYNEIRSAGDVATYRMGRSIFWYCELKDKVNVLCSLAGSFHPVFTPKLLKTFAG